MSYSKRVFEEGIVLEQQKEILLKRIRSSMVNPFKGSEWEYIKSVRNLIALMEVETNLAILEPMSKAIGVMVNIGVKTWGWEVV